MIIDLAYGDNKVVLDFPENRIIKILEPKPLPVPLSEFTLLRKALEKPIGSAPLREIIQKGESACIIVGDTTRLSARYNLMVMAIIEELHHGGISDRDIFIISATGDHREQSPEEHRKIVGEEVYKRVRVFDHRSRAAEELTYLGTTSFGTPVRINSKVTEAERVILTGSIVYHFLAGWGGGKKALLPGVAGYDTIMKNHSLAFYQDPGKGLNPAVCAGKTIDNPCSSDMQEGAAFVKPDFIINSIINDEEYKIAYAVAGDFIKAHEKGCALVNKHFGITLERQAELVIASCGGYPKDINFYQSYKTIYNAHFALKKGGTLLLVSESREGVGSDDFSTIFNSHHDNSTRETALRNSYSIGGHMGYHAAVMAKEYDILVLSSLEAAELNKMGMAAIRNLQEGLSFIRKKHGSIPPAYIMPYGGSTLPLLTRH